MAISITSYDQPAQAGAWVGVRGSGFNDVLVAWVGDFSSSINKQSDDYIYVYLDAMISGTQELTLSGNDSSGGDVRDKISIDVVAAAQTEEPKPEITSVEPSSFPAGAVDLVIRGSNLSTVNRVRVDNDVYTDGVSAPSNEEVRVHVPLTVPGTSKVSVETVARRDSNGIEVTIH